MKHCWRDESGAWMSSGGFPIQMAGLGSLFDEMTLVTSVVPPRDGGLPLPANIRVVALHEPSGEDARRKLSVVAHLPHYLLTIAQNVRRADVVHTPLPGDLPLLGMLVTVALRKALIVRYGGSWQATAQTTRMNRITQGLMRRFAGKRNVMLVTGAGTGVPAPRMHWIFSTALSEQEIASINPNLCRPAHNPLRLVYIGRLSSEKGVDKLVRAMGLVRKQGVADLPALTIIGDGPERGKLEQITRVEGCADAVHFTGQLDRASLSRELLDMDLCVQPSLTEGFSKAWLDAMAHGLPVLASEVGAARRVIGGDEERGWLVPPGDVEALAVALCKVIDGPVDWPALRRRCREYVEGQTLEAWAQMIGEICARQWGIALVDGKLQA
ncbi:MAG: glycosyltransferase family 4 protein [Chloroflexia bacterium]